jgi:hypothetical protein
MDRRDFLAGAAATVPFALAGCLGGPGDDGTTSDDTGSTGNETLSVGDEASLSGDRALSVAGVDASAVVVSRDGADRTVHSGNTTRYVHVALRPTGVDDRERFAAEHVTLTVNDETFADPVFPLGGGSNRFVAAFPVPTDVTPYTASVEVDTGDAAATWEFTAREIEAITKTVDYAVTDVSLPESVEPGATFTAELAVSNNGDPMAFTVQHETGAGAGRDSFDLPAGEESAVELELTAPGDPDEGDDGAAVELDWGARSVARVVPYDRGGSETTTTSP